MPTQTFKVGEMLNKRTPFSKTWINFDGSYTTEIYNIPVHYEDENGNLHNINTDLYDEADLDQVDFPVAKEGAEEFRIMKTACSNMKKKNILDRDTLDYQGLKVPFDCRIPKNFKRGYTIGKGQHRLRFIPVGASPSKGYIEQDKKNCVHYQDAWNDTDVCLEVMPNGVKETIILKSDRAPFSFSFEVDGPLEDDLTAGELKLQPAWLQDANGEKRDVSQTVRREGDKTFIDLVADVTGLTYPIEIDPTVTIQPDGTAGKDTFVRSAPNHANNYGTLPTIDIGRTSYGTNRALLQFDLSTIPNGITVTSANLELVVSSVTSPSNYNFDIHRVTSGWNETTVTWETQPSFDSTEKVTFQIGNTGIVSVNIASIVQKWFEGFVNYGILIKNDTEDSTVSAKTIHSSESSSPSSRPKLTVTYNIPPTAPIVTSPNGGETWNAQHTITWIAATDQQSNTIYTPLAQGGSATYYTNWRKMWQPFSNQYNSHITKIKVKISTNAVQTLYIGLIELNASDNPTGVTYGEVQVTTPSSGFQDYEVTLPSPVKLPVGKRIAVQIRGSVSNNIAIAIASTKVNGSFKYEDNVGGIYSNGNYDMYFEITYTEGLDPLQYQIQLSPDNGQSWKDIVALTSPGATSYTYDFSNEPETSLAKIRIRAYDGSAYGPWDESDGVFTIQHNQAPTVPTSLSPSGGVAKDRASVIRLAWQHNDANGDPQAQFDLQWRKQGDTTWNTVSQVTPNQYWDAPANTFPRGTIEWQVRTYDQAGLSSPFSDIQTFFAGDKPANPTITDPANGAIVPVANPVVQWSSVGQTAYHVKLLDSNDNLLWELQANSTNKAQTILYALQNNEDYKIQLAIKNADGIWSDFVTVNIHVSYTPPAVPIVTTTKGDGIITISIDNPTPSGTQPNVSYNDLYRRKQGESTWTRIAKNIPADASFVDYTPSSGQVYEYFVRAWGDNGTYSDSLIVSQSISFIGVWLHEAANPLETLHQFKLVSDRSGNWQPTATMMQFAGRRLPVAEYDDTEQHSVSVKFSLLKDSGDLEALEKLIRSKNTLCYRDARGRKMFCHVFQLPVDDEVYGNTVSLTFEEVSYTEEV
jgi:hypothetical protein